MKGTVSGQINRLDVTPILWHIITISTATGSYYYYSLDVITTDQINMKSEVED